MKSKTKNDAKLYVPNNIIKIFVFLIVLSYILTLGTMLWQGLTQYLYNPNMGGYYGFMFSSILLPFLLFSIAFLINPRKLSSLEKSFESIIFAIAASSLWIFVYSYIPIYIVNGPDYIEGYARFEIISTTVFLSIYTLLLLWFRVSKKWK
jgi:hypothetical protein